MFTSSPAPIVEARLDELARSLRFEVHAADDRFISRHLIDHGCWEPFETEIVRRLMVPDALVVDGGANLGWYSVVAAASGAQVVAFEPDPTNAALLRRNVALNDLDGSIEVHEAALGARAGTAHLHQSADNLGDHRVLHHVAGTRRVIGVPVVRLVDVLGGRRPDLIKLDTQGSESAILAGAGDAWRHADIVLILECWPRGLTQCGSSADELLDLLAVLVGGSHACFDIVEWQRTLVPTDIAQLRRRCGQRGFTPQDGGFMNLAVVPTSRVGLVADLVGVQPAE